MPRRRRRQELKRAARKVSQEAERVARSLGLDLSHEEQVERAWRDHTDGGWCCLDCDPHHPDRVLSDAQDEIDTHLNRRST